MYDLTHLNINSSLKDLRLWDIRLDINSPAKEVYNIFKSNPAVPAVILENNGKYVGIVSRRSFFEIMSRPFSLELFLQRPIETFYIDTQTKNTIIASIDMLISSAAEQALNRKSEIIYEPIVVMLENGTFKVLDIDHLLLAQSKIHVQTLDQLQKNVAYIKNLLNNAGQGFLSFKRDMLIEPAYSSECNSIFGFEIERLYFPSLIAANDKKQQQFLNELLLQIIDENDKFTRRTLISLLPEEVVINGKNIFMEFKTIKEFEDGFKSRKMMAILTDITERRKLEQERNRERDIFKMIVKVVVDYNDFISVLKDYKQFCTSDLEFMVGNCKSTESVVFEIYRAVHTYKGNFAQFGLNETSKKLHHLESQISAINETGNDQEFEDFKELLFNSKIETWVNGDVALITSILGEEFLHKDSTVPVKIEKIIEIENIIESLYSDDEMNQLLLELKKIRSPQFKELLRQYTDYTFELARRLGKYIEPFEIEGGDFYIDQNIYSAFTKSLIHVFRNLVDHGIEDPDTRAAMGKEEIGEISVKVEIIDEEIILSISDNGAGIDIEKIKEKAVKKGIAPKFSLDNLPENLILQLIFQDNFSTRDEASELSGRGVGLAAVKSELNKIGGACKIETKPGEGTTFIFTMPYIPLLKKKSENLNKAVDLLTAVAREYLDKEINLKSRKVPDTGDSANSQIELLSFSSLISVEGEFNGNIIISVEDQLAQELFCKLVPDTDDLEDDVDYKREATSEALNVILGNSTSLLSQRGFPIEISPPVVFDKTMEIVGEKRYVSKLKSDKGVMMLYLTSNN